VHEAPGPQGDLAEPLVQLDAGLAGCEQEHAACLADRPDVAAARAAQAPAAPPQPCPSSGASPSASGVAARAQRKDTPIPALAALLRARRPSARRRCGQRRRRAETLQTLARAATISGARRRGAHSARATTRPPSSYGWTSRWCVSQFLLTKLCTWITCTGCVCNKGLSSHHLPCWRMQLCAVSCHHRRRRLCCSAARPARCAAVAADDRDTTHVRGYLLQTWTSRRAWLQCGRAAGAYQARPDPAPAAVQAAARAARARLSHALAEAGAALARLAAYLAEPPGASPAAALAALAAFRSAFDRSYAHVASLLAEP